MTTLAAPRQENNVVYPISPDYVKQWTAERAIAELVSNAIDEDPGFSYEWADGVLTIEDSGPGIPQSGLVLGWSNKTSSQIGMWGEGAKLACLVLARTPSIGEVVFETVGFGFVPTIQRTNFSGLPGGDADDGAEMLHCSFFGNDRVVGTKVTVECSEALARKVKQRFRYLTVPGYKPPTGDGEVIAGTDQGSVYIGGVFVSQNKNLRFSYDLSLEATKTMQNRDRTVIEGYALDSVISSIWNETADKPLVEERVRAALAGELKSRPESCFSNPHPSVRLVLRELGDKLYGGNSVCYDPDHNTEATLDLQDRGYEVLRADKMNAYDFNGLMREMGVPKANSLYNAPKKQETEWAKKKDVSPEQNAVLETAITLVRRAYGLDAVDKVRVYLSTRIEDQDKDLAFGGYYVPTGKGLIALHIKNLNRLDDALKVLVHEAAHRIRHRTRGWDYQDRTRGFEQQLGDMAAQVLLQVHESGALPALEKPAAPAPEVVTVASRFKKEVLLPQLRASGCATATAFAAKTGLSLSNARMLYSLKAPACRQGHVKMPQIEAVKVACEYIDLDWPVVHLLLFSGRIDSLSRNKSGRLSAFYYGTAAAAVAKLRADGYTSELCDALDDVLSYKRDVEATQAPFAQLLQLVK